MTARAQLRRASSPPRWWPTLLVLGLLAGLVGMHGLAPGGTTAVTGHHSSTAAHADMAIMGAEPVCDRDGDGSGHAPHADPTCASGAVGAGPALPALVPDPFGQAGAPVSGLRSMAAEPEGGRAPPSLAGLQILRR
ncbi:DUF6153 family protein [Streptomyces heilongjiangensis]|nr:DUF6153 family protein [Streptomyces heilongjiangensis]MDC2950587.1 DUF6153 family protein [Streptomyces heilongjiangensis]